MSAVAAAAAAHRSHTARRMDERVATGPGSASEPGDRNRTTAARRWAGARRSRNIAVAAVVGHQVHLQARHNTEERRAETTR